MFHASVAKYNHKSSQNVCFLLLQWEKCLKTCQSVKWHFDKANLQLYKSIWSVAYTKVSLNMYAFCPGSGSLCLTWREISPDPVALQSLCFLPSFFGFPTPPAQLLQMSDHLLLEYNIFIRPVKFLSPLGAYFTLLAHSSVADTQLDDVIIYCA